MKKLCLIVLAVITLAACNIGKKDKSEAGTIAIQEPDGLVSYKYKVIGLQDSIITDSIWKIIFQVEGVDKLILSKTDCTAVFTVDPELITNELLVKEITERGGVLQN
ncbi:MAG: hypothetical protein JW894_01145 [Bacteroidales bacterium]|nr:hypothetical protein [Bacteroidales bacterium]